MNTQITKTLIIAGSIIIAGALIAAALILKPTGIEKPAKTVDIMEKLEEIAEDLGVRGKDFASCMESNDYAAKITSHQESVGNVGTPYSIVSNGEIGIAISGALPAEMFALVAEAVRSGDVSEILAQEGAENYISEVEPLTIAENDHVKGSSDATVTIFEYSDIDCPFCGKLHPELGRLVSENETINWVYRHYPLESIHPNAKTKAIAAECVGELAGGEAFYEYLGVLFS